MNKTRQSIESLAIDDELALVAAMCAFLRVDGYRPRLEVPNMGQYIDIVATRGRWVLAIEAKLRDWGRALKQINGHYVVADFLAVGLVGKAVSSKLLDKASKHQVGIILCDPETGICSWALKPELNKKVWLPQRRQFAEKLKDIAYAN